MNKLRWCPFCKNPKISSCLNDSNVGIVACHVCGGQVRYHGSVEEAEKIWNGEFTYNQMVKIKVGDVLEVILSDGAVWYGLCVSSGIVYITHLHICKEISEVEIKSVSRWEAGSMNEIWSTSYAQVD